jgi:hypothetical protein
LDDFNLRFAIDFWRGLEGAAKKSCFRASQPVVHAYFSCVTGENAIFGIFAQFYFFIKVRDESRFLFRAREQQLDAVTINYSLDFFLFVFALGETGGTHRNKTV